MGLRSWLTPVYSEIDLNQVKKYAESSGYGINYIIQVSKSVYPFEKGEVIVAWSGDTNSSLDGLRPSYCKRNTILLDEFLEINPIWHQGERGPKNFGAFINEEQAMPNWNLIKTDKKKLTHDENEFWLEYFAFDIENNLQENISSLKWSENYSSIEFQMKDKSNNLYSIKINEQKEVIIEKGEDKYKTYFEHLTEALKQFHKNRFLEKIKQA